MTLFGVQREELSWTSCRMSSSPWVVTRRCTGSIAGTAATSAGGIGDGSLVAFASSSTTSTGVVAFLVQPDGASRVTSAAADTIVRRLDMPQ